MERPFFKRASTLPLVLIIMAFLIIIFGGMIRIFDAGESCPDWPGCFGQWSFVVTEEEQNIWYESHPSEIDSRGMDHRYSTFEIFLEWFHRVLVGVIAIPIIYNMYKSYNKREFWGSNVSRTALISGALLVIQAIVGALTVKYDNSDWSVAIHLVLALLFTSFLIWQWMLMRRNEDMSSVSFEVNSSFIKSERPRMIFLSISVLILLILGSWVASTAGGNYNKGCSIGFPNGWPTCNGDFFPSFDGPGVLVQMLHRIGAAIVGLVLVIGSFKVKEKTKQFEAPIIFSRCIDISMGFWLLNVFVGGLYIVLAKIDEFPEYLSLLHLLLGIASFISVTVGAMLVTLAIPKDGEESE